MFDRSIKRAESLMGELGRQKAIVVKISQSDCHCFHCWPDTWAAVNEHLGDAGPLEDESDLLVQTGGGDIVLECHESGPEVVAFLNAATAVTALAAGITSLVAVIVAARRKEAQPTGRSIHLKVAHCTRGIIDQTTMIDLELSSSGNDEKAIAQAVESAIRSCT